MDAFTIKDLENLSGIKAHTIRIWEQRYTFLKPERTDTNIRYYNSQQLVTILNISLLNKYGYKISHIDRMSEVEIKDKILSLSQSQAQQERVVNDLIERMIGLELNTFEQILDTYIQNKGVEKTIPQIIFPFLERIGILWLTNHINPAQEHLVTNIIRQKLIIGIESIKNIFQINKTALLFLPEGEHHELGLLFMYYLLKSRGVNILYLGAAVPLKNVDYIARLKKPELIYTHLTSVAHNFNFEKFLNNFHQKMPEFKLVVSGQLTQSYKKRVPQNISLKTSLSEVMEYVASV
jgi:DNA-binding transcriptional MerR regulator